MTDFIFAADISQLMKGRHLSLARRILNNPAAYVQRTSSMSTARRWAAARPNGRIIAGPVVGQWWVTHSGAVAKALRLAGFEAVA